MNPISPIRRDVTFTAFVAPTDIDYFPLLIPHLVRMCRYPFVERVALLDKARPTGDFVTRGRGRSTTWTDVERECARLIDSGMLDRVIEIDYRQETVDRFNKHYFGKTLRHTHNYRGGPIYPFVFTTEAITSRYVIHFDSDMLLHQSEQYDWISRGIEHLEKFPDVMIACPLSGPPSLDGTLQQHGVPYEHDNRGFWRFRRVTGRKFLMDRQKLSNSLPMDLSWISPKRRILGTFTGNSALTPWEDIASQFFIAKNLWRADLDSNDAWTLHTPDHGPLFVKSLPAIIQLVEQGRFPEVQRGEYDLLLEEWQQLL